MTRYIVKTAVPAAEPVKKDKLRADAAREVYRELIKYIEQKQSGNCA